MIATTRRLLLASMMCLASPWMSLAEEEVFRFFFRYGFGDGQVGDPDSQPTEDDVKGLMCATNDFFTDALKNSTNNDSVEFYATEITYGFEKYIYEGSEPEAPRNVPVEVKFTAKIVTTDGSTPPTLEDFWEDTKYYEYFSYIRNYIWKIEGSNFFKDTRGLWYEPFIQDPEEGQIKDNDKCPSPGDTNRVDTGFELQPDDTPMPTPTPAPVGRADTGFQLQSMGPTTAEDEMVYFTIQIDFFAGREKEPTDAEVEAMMCEADRFFQETLKSKISSDVDVHSTNIYWEWDDRAALPSMVEFYADARDGSGNHVPAEQVFNAMESIDVKQFVQNYIWNANPYKENVFYQTEDIFFAGRYSGSANPPVPHEGKLARAQCG